MSSDKLEILRLQQFPSPGTRKLCFRGQSIEISLKATDSCKGKAYLRTNLGHAEERRGEIIAAVEEHRPRLETDWHDVPMEQSSEAEYIFQAALDEVGIFEAKAFFVAEADNRIYWPKGANIKIKVEPAALAAANTVYTAFIRQFGPNQYRNPLTQSDDRAAEELEGRGCTVIPPSGKFRDLIKELDLIIGEMGFRTIQLMPIHPIPATYARMGRFGSPFAALDFTNVDPGLAEFDGRTTPLEQFMELVQEIHRREGRVIIDIPPNHTGWASVLQIHHPEWFPRHADGSFQSPGAWGVVWADLSELDYSHESLWQYMAEVFLYWCGKGVDGFRCDAGYMLPFGVWEYIVAKVREIYPETIFLLEGLGGKTSTTEKLLGDAGLNWAYSELFQNYTRDQIENYLPWSFEIEAADGLLVNYAETHDNNRLAARSETFARMRTAVCALCSQGGTFGVTNGVEWLAKEKIDVHEAKSLNWGAEENLVDWLRRLNAIICYHPAFQIDSERRMCQFGEGNVLAMLRRDSSKQYSVLVLANLSDHSPESVHWRLTPEFKDRNLYDLLRDEFIPPVLDQSTASRRLEPGEVRCLTAEQWDLNEYINLQTFDQALNLWRFRAKYTELKRALRHDSVPLPGVSPKEIEHFIREPFSALRNLSGDSGSPWITYTLPEDPRRDVMVPPDMLLVVEGADAFMLIERSPSGEIRYTDHSLASPGGGHFVAVPPVAGPDNTERSEIELHMYVPAQEGPTIVKGTILRLSPYSAATVKTRWSADELNDSDGCGLSVNSRSSAAYFRSRWPEIRSQYDCLLALNPAPDFPADRRVLWTRCRCWAVYRDYSRELNSDSLSDFQAGPGQKTSWRFMLPIGQGLVAPLRVELEMERNRDRVTMSFYREEHASDPSYPLLAENEPVTLIVRPDLEDRDFHTKTKAFTGPEEIFPKAVSLTEKGLNFQPTDFKLSLESDNASFVLEPEWQYMVEHPIDGDRGLDHLSDLFSPGYFQSRLKAGEAVKLTGEGCPVDVPAPPVSDGTEEISNEDKTSAESGKTHEETISIREAASRASRDFIVSRNHGRTVIAGYPWFLDWGRDTLIALRGIIAAGWTDIALAILKEFARFENQGTLPNMIHGDNVSNRDTSDAPLWFIVASRDLLRKTDDRELLKTDCGGRSLERVLISIAENYCSGTANGIMADQDSGLVFSPDHFTWMDTQFPAGTPRAGYPIEIQALWSAGLEFLAELPSADKKRWRALRKRVNESIEKYYPGTSDIGLADCLHADRPGLGAADCVADDHCRPNQLLAVTLANILSPERRKEVVESCWKLLVPGGIRSLADRPVQFPLPVYGNNGELLNDPNRPYWGVYRGDEDTRRKPAYHNGTAWTWIFPSFCEALVQVYGDTAKDTALALLGSAALLFNRGCAGHLPEILDGDAPHKERGCGAQAWAATEVTRVAELLS